MPGHSSESKSGLHRSLTVREVAHVVDNLDAFQQASHWVENYLAQPHPQLGRPGAVCPFAHSALVNDSICIAVVRLDPDRRRERIREAIEFHLNAFLARGTTEGQRALQATLILFPDVSPEEAPDLIDGTKEELKAAFIKQGLMLGEFHASNTSPGLHNPNFMPLRSPIPMLAIRRMVATDLAFLDRPEYDAKMRLGYLKAYLEVANIPPSAREELEKKVEVLEAEIKYQPVA